jgi:capsular exopolysaccharide synthesis family protein
VLEGLILDENKARIEAESNNEIVRVGRPANVPTKPVLPNPMLIFGAGIFLSIAAGFLFVLILDNLEDTIVNLSDIENRLALKVLAVLPHIRRKKRQQVARYAVDEKYSQFSEAVAGLRNLLDSPRYEALSHCILVISTQPGEGKTITSSSLAITYAQAGKRTLHVDFDLRRPRLAKIWEFELTKENSFSNVMQEASENKAIDFSKLVNKTEVDNLDVIASLDPDGVSPSQILGSSAVTDFFEWARSNYDRVIIDSPPYGIVGDVVSLAVAADSVIIMCCPDRTHFKPIRHCSRTLTEAGANILGVVVNDVDYSNISAFSLSHSYGYRKYGYSEYAYGYHSYAPKKGDKDKGPEGEAAGDETKGEWADEE